MVHDVAFTHNDVQLLLVISLLLKEHVPFNVLLQESDVPHAVLLESDVQHVS